MKNTDRLRDANMQKKIVSCENGTIKYWTTESIHPKRKSIFFLHGMTADHTMFEQQFEVFKKDYNLFAWDAPAHGESRPYRNFSFFDTAECMLKILHDHHIRDVIVVGQSMGGYFAQAFIKKYPEKVKGFVSIGSTPFGHRYYSKTDIWFLKQVEWMAKLYPFHAMKKAIAKQVSVTQRAYDNMMEMLSTYDKTELYHLMGIAYAGFLKENADMDIPCPVLLLVGEHDKTGKVKAYNKAWTKTTGYPLVLVPDAAHNANVDNPDFVNKHISDFIEGLK